MFEDLTWKRGSGETGVIGRFAELAKKASQEAGAEVMIVMNFPEGYLHVVASTPGNPASDRAQWTPEAVAKGLSLLRRWLRNLEGDDTEIRAELEALNTMMKHEGDNR